jgi:hypothetical protein
LTVYFRHNVRRVSHGRHPGGARVTALPRDRNASAQSMLAP